MPRAKSAAPPAVPETYLTMKECGERFNLSWWTIRDYHLARLHNGFPSRKFGKAVRIPLSEVVKWFEDLARQSDPLNPQRQAGQQYAAQAQRQKSRAG